MMQPATARGPQPGELIADFSGDTADGRTIVRRDYKGRRHLVLCFAGPLPAEGHAALAAALAARHAAFREAGAEAVVFSGDAASAAPYPILADAGGQAHERYGATTALLIVADRYGEVVVRRALADFAADLDEALAATEWLQMRCSL